MRLDPHGREHYQLTIITDPQVDAWETSFDDGTTWIPGTPAPGVDNTWQWLIAGHLADPGDAVAVIRRSLTPIIRAVDNPEIIARRRDVPPIHYKTA